MGLTAKTGSRSRLFAVLLAEWSVSHLGHYAVMATLSLYLLRALNLPTPQVAVLMLLFSLSLRLARIFLAPLVDRIPSRLAIVLALSTACLGYVGLANAHSALSLTLLLPIVGIGYGTNALAVKVLAGSAANRDGSTLLRYASLSTALNLAAAVGPIIGNAIFLHWAPGRVFLMAAAAYGLAAIAALWLPAAELEAPRRASWVMAMKVSWQIPAVRQTLVLSALGWFLYSQLYATLPLFVGSALGTPQLLGTFFSLNAVLVVTGQMPLSQLTLRFNLHPVRMIYLAFAGFAVGFALLWLFPRWQFAYAAVAIWTLAEMLLMPALDTLVAGSVDSEDRVIAFALNSVAIAIGEGVGNLAGVWTAGWFLQNNAIRHTYGLFALWALLAAVVAIFPGRTPRTA